ncbi:MAG: 16S rRNA (cytosine(967)-C(5))-methyltransferase RsmB [Pseudomonadales bacterium]
MTPPEIRAAAARLLHAVVVLKKTSDQAMGDERIDPLTRELFFGSMRRYFSLSSCVSRSLHQSVRAKDRDIWCLFIVGAYQLNHTRIPDHAAINETVAACRTLGKPWATRWVNGVLRNLKPPERSFEHPEWMERQIVEDYGEDAAALLLANNERAPMTLRVNRARIPAADYGALLEAAGIGYRTCKYPIVRPDGPGPEQPGETLILHQPLPAERLPGFAEGLVAVQDAGAQLAAPLLAAEDLAPLPPGTRVLDACAAPGGKLFHFHERFPAAELSAVELSEARLPQLRAEAQRLQHEGLRTLLGDATDDRWWDGRPFQRILADAPCSGSGTLRRHPDIKLLRQRGDLEAYTALQRALLDNLWRMLEPGGTLLYCTCSIFAAENDDVIMQFLAATADARPSPFVLTTGRATRCGWQLLPTDPDTDGFYYARLHKVPA